MKAIIMAGGEGSRLRPLTCGRPKPMVPVMNRPIMAHIIQLLKKHGLRNIGITLQYMPETIRDHFGKGIEYGVNCKYFIEDVPLGTAGSVKNAESFLDETFVVISGDALTDLNLSQAVEFHKQKGAIATLVLTQVDSPLEYGVVITDESGRVRQFLEKPSWGEVFSDTVNTGIYILEPEVLTYFEAGQKFDFSKDLFPLLLRKGLPLYGVTVPGYWCDIGNLQQYLQAHYDILNGKVQVEIPDREIAPGIWAGENTEIHPSAKIESPALIGDGSRLGAEVSIEPYTVIGENCSISHHSSLKRSVLWNNVTTGPSSSLRGVVIGSRVQIQTGAGVYEGAVIGSDCQIKERSIVKPNVKLWPQKTVEAGSIVQNSIIWGTRQPKRLFGLEGVSGLINLEITPEFTARLAAAYASTLGSGARMAISSDAYTASEMLRKAASCGLQSAGAEVHDLGTGITPMHRFAIRKYKFTGGIHIKASPRQPGAVNIILTNEKGSNLPRNKERKVENIMAREDFRRAETANLVPDQFVPGVPETYLESIMQKINKEEIRNSGYKVVMAYDHTTLGSFVELLCNQFNIEVDNFILDKHERPQSWPDYQKILPQFTETVVKKKASFGIILEHDADRIILVDDQGQIIQEDLLTALIALLVLKSKSGPVVVPVTAPKAIESLAQKYAGRVVRTKTAVQDFLEKLIVEEEKSSNKKKTFSQFLMNFDGIFAFCNLLEFMSLEKVTLSQLRDEIPAFFMDKKDVSVPWEAKGRVIRRLIGERSPEELELLDGVKVYHPNGWTLVLPDPEEPVCRVFSEGISMEVAESLSNFYIDKINSIVGEEKEVG